jgi:outer membrane protein assembly factor BamB
MGDSLFIGGNTCYSLGNIYVTTKRGNVYAVNAANGDVIWKKNFDTIIRGAPVAREDKLLFVTSDNRAVSVRVSNGSIIWQHNGLLEASKILSSPAPLLVGNNVIVTYSSGEVFMLDFNTGSEVWSAEMAKSTYGAVSAFMNDISYSPVLHNNVVYVVSSDGTLNALDEHGKVIWTFEGEQINNSPWPVGDMLFDTTRDGGLIAVSAHEGKLVWRNRLATQKEIDSDKLQFTGVIMAAGKLFVADDNGRLYSYSSKDGSMLKKYTIPDGAILAPVIADGKMFFITRDSELVELK